MIKLRILALIAIIALAFGAVTAAYYEHWPFTGFCAVLAVMCYLYADK